MAFIILHVFFLHLASINGDIIALIEFDIKRFFVFDFNLY